MEYLRPFLFILFINDLVKETDEPLLIFVNGVETVGENRYQNPAVKIGDSFEFSLMCGKAGHSVKLRRSHCRLKLRTSCFAN